jgi:hypothetical protein
MADVTCWSDIQQLCQPGHGGGNSLVAAMHAGGVIHDATLLNQSSSGIAAVLAPKATGTVNLAWGLRHQPVHIIALFSSTSALLAPPGQGSYSAANAVMDALGEARQRTGTPTVSIQWGAWSAGMASRSAAVASRISKSGLGTIAPHSGLAVLGRLVSRPGASAWTSTVLASPIDWSRLQASSGGAAPPLFGEFQENPTVEVAKLGGDQLITPMLPVLPRGSASRRPSVLGAHVRALVASVLGREVLADEPLMDAGLDSLGRNRGAVMRCRAVVYLDRR